MAEAGPDVQRFLDLMERGEVKDRDLERRIYADKAEGDNDGKAGLCAATLAVQVRRRRLEKLTGVDMSVFDSVPAYNFKGVKDNRVLTQIEGCIGGAYPTAAPSPLKGHATYEKDGNVVTIVDGEVRVLLSTHETALVAGLNRGVGILNKGYTTGRSGGRIAGVSAHVYRDCMTRAGGIECPGIHYATDIERWIRGNIPALKVIFDSVSEGGHADLKRIEVHRTGSTLHVRTVGTFGEAMGMNSATEGTEEVCKRIAEEWPEAVYWTASTNMCTDKKQSAINILDGRGVGVVTETFVPESVLKDSLRERWGDAVDRTSVSRIMDGYNRKKNWEGSGMAGTLSGFNANISNTVAALFIANGDDAAQIVESSAGYTFAEAREDGLLFGCKLPNLEVAAVGGGTSNPFAQAGLRLMGCDRAANSEGYFDGRNRLRKAAIYAMYATAQEFNTLFALTAAKDLAKSHFEMVGRA